jgi:hypothetical protein
MTSRSGKGNHATNSKSCHKWNKKNQIQEIKIIFNDSNGNKNITNEKLQKLDIDINIYEEVD